MLLRFIYPPGRLGRLPDIRARLAPTEFFFGGIEAERYATVEHAESAPSESRFRSITALSRFLAARRSVGQSRADCIVIVDERLVWALPTYAALLGLNVPIVAIRCRSAHLKNTFHLHRSLMLRLEQRASHIFLSEDEARLFSQRTGIISSSISAHPFGVDSDFWIQSNREERLVVTVGDSGRDYPTLLTASQKIEAPILGISDTLSRMKLPPSLNGKVTAVRGSYREQAITDLNLREVYSRAACVVVPLDDKDTSPVGQSVCLQAMSCGKPVVLTRTQASWSKALRDGENMFYVPPRDPAALAAITNRLLDDGPLRARIGAAARKTVLQDFQISAFSNAVLTACDKAIALQRTTTLAKSVRTKA